MDQSAHQKAEALSSVDRALSLLELLAVKGGLNLTELADQLQANKTTVYRLASALTDRGWLVKDEDRHYRLGPALLALSLGTDRFPDLRQLFLPIMLELRDETRETIHLTRLEGRYVVYLHQLQSPQPVVSLATLGGRSPAHCVSPGLALLAASTQSKIDWVLDAPLVKYTDLSMTSGERIREELALVQERGYAINRGAYRGDVGGVGVAIRDARGTPVAGLSVCMPIFRMSKVDLDELGKRLMKAARDAVAVLQQEMPDVAVSERHDVAR